MKRTVFGRRPTWTRRLVLLGLALMAASLAFGGTLETTPLKGLIRSSDLIVRGTVQAVETGPAGEDAPSTTVVLSVQQQWKGPRLSTVHLIQPRGVAGGIAREVPGLPRFYRGEEVILFLVEEAPHHYGVLGGKQGKFSIKADPRSGTQVDEDLTGAQFELTQFMGAVSALTKAAR